MYRFEYRWTEMQKNFRTAVARANDGNEWAWREVQEYVFTAGVFAMNSVRTMLATHEDRFVRWSLGDALYGLPAHVESETRMRDYVENVLTLDVLADTTGNTLADHIEKHVKYLGPAKATFTAACLGYEHAGCIDTNMGKALGLPKQYSSMKQYRAAYAKTGWGGTLDQWRMFLTVKGFADSQHDCYFDLQGIRPAPAGCI